MKSKLGALVVLIALSSLVMMMGYQKYAPQRAQTSSTLNLPKPPSTESPLPSRRKPIHSEPTVSPEPQTQTAKLYVMRSVGQEMVLTPVTTRLEEPGPLAALKALAAYQSKGDEEPILPKGTQVRGLTVSPTGTATADFSQEIVDNFPGGSRTEQLLLASIVDTLTQFPQVKRVMITVDGKPVDSIGGHIDLDEPLERDMSVVAKGDGN